MVFYILFTIEDGNPLATHMGYSPKALRTGFGVEGITTIDASGYDVFFPRHMSGDLVVEWMAIRVLGFLRFAFVFRQKPEVNSLLLYLFEVMMVN
jgi:hypothetical protein